MGSPARRLINPITRCWAHPNYGYAGTDDRRGTDLRLDTKRLTLMSERRTGGRDADMSVPCVMGAVGSSRVRHVLQARSHDRRVWSSSPNLTRRYRHPNQK